MYVALANFAYAGKTYFVGDAAPFAENLIKNGLIGYDEELSDDIEDDEDGSVSGDK
jgi:hypothetical protein